MIQRRLKYDDIIFCGGAIDSILSKFLMGHGTSLRDRLNDDYTPKQNSLSVRLNDIASMIHDIAYDKNYKNYSANPTLENKKNQFHKYGMRMISLKKML